MLSKETRNTKKMPGKSERVLKTSFIIMWCSFLLTIPTWIYWLINFFGQSSFEDMLVESGFIQNLRIITLTSILLPVLGLILAIYARVVITVQNQQYSFYPQKGKHMLYNNVLIGYFMVLGIIGIIYLLRN